MSALTSTAVSDMIKASGVDGRTFDEIAQEVHATYGAVDVADLRVFLDELLGEKRIGYHPVRQNRFVHRNHYPPVRLRIIDGSTSLTDLPEMLYGTVSVQAGDVVAGDAAPGASRILTVDHLAFVSDGEQRVLVVYDRPVFPPPAGPGVTVRPNLMGP